MALKFPRISVNRTWLMLVVAIVLALLATVLTTQYLKNREQTMAAQMAAQANQGGPKISVVVPIRDLPVGTPLESNLVAARDVQIDLVYPDAIKVDDFDRLKGQSLIRPVFKGRPLLAADLRPMYADFAGTLADGTRAMTIDIDELNSISHMVQPGNRIDLMLAMKRDDGGQTVVPFMDQMKVLATGQKVIQDTGEDKVPGAPRRTLSYANLTLEVTPVQAARLTLAQDIGKLRAVLRNETDKKNADYAITAQNVFDEVAERTRLARAQMPRRAAMAGAGAGAGAGGPTVEYIIGGARSGPAAKAVDVPMGGALPPGAMVPPLIPNPAVYGPPGGGAAPALPPPGASSGYTPPNTAQGGSSFDSAGLTPETRKALQDVLKSN